MQKRLYTGFSFFELLTSLAYRICLIIVIILTYPHFTENPIVISIVCGLCVIGILILGNDEIVVYEDKIVVASLSFGSLIFGNNKKSILFSDIKRVFIKEEAKSTLSEIVVAVVIIAATYRYRNTHTSNFNSIYFELNDGSITELSTDLEVSATEKIVEIVNSALQKKY